MNRLIKYVRQITRVHSEDGFIGVVIRALTVLQKKRARARAGKRPQKVRFLSPARREDVLAADWVSNPYDESTYVPRHTKTISWLMSPPGSGGGHQNIFRFIEYLDAAGYTNHVYLFSKTDSMTPAEAKETVSHYCTAKKLHFHEYRDAIEPSDVVFATTWETAYAVFTLKTDALKYYFVQDFEPYFYPVGTNYLLAENTYRFGFRGVIAGAWLRNKLITEYGMACDSYSYGTDKKLYRHTNDGERREVFFYARPATERRGFEMGAMALELFHRAMPDYTINLAGEDVSTWGLPFPYVDHRVLKLNQLSEVYNRCAVGLCLSLTDMSLLPLELLACGTIAVVNDAVSNRQTSDNPFIAYAQPSPQALADAMIAVVTRKDLPEYARQASESVAAANWDIAGRQFVDLINRATSND